MALKDLSEAVDLLEAAAASVHNSMANGTFEKSDLRFFFPVVLKFYQALNGSGNIIAELKGANGEELQAEWDRASQAAQLIFDDLFYPKQAIEIPA